MSLHKLRLFHAADRWTALRLAVCLVCSASVIVFVWGSRHWAVVNDAAQIDYVCFLMDHGRVPYRDIIEMNMPGIYLINGGILHLFGSSAIAWRCFDISLLLIAGCAMFSIAKPYDWLGGIYAGALFALFHGRDGPSQAGQRDLIIAVLLICACSLIFSALRTQRLWLLGLAGVCLSAAATIKPVYMLFAIFLLPVVLIRMRESRKSASWWMLGGFSVPLLVVGRFLLQRGALSSYAYVFYQMLPFYARLGRSSAYSLISHCLTPSLATIALMGFIIAVLRRSRWQWEERILLCGMALGMLTYFVQGKGFSYHRYPFFAFLLLWSGIQMAQMLRVRDIARPVAIAGLLFGTITAPLYAKRAIHRFWDESYNVALAQDLVSLGGARLSNHVQCFTTAGDCDTTLYRLNLVQSSGLIYDYFVFGSLKEPVVQLTRQRIWTELQQNTPKIIIIGRGKFPDDADNTYNKIAGWPSLDAFLTANYTVYAERSFSPAECGIRGYRLYVLNPIASLGHQSADTGLCSSTGKAISLAARLPQTQIH